MSATPRPHVATTDELAHAMAEALALAARCEALDDLESAFDWSVRAVELAGSAGSPGSLGAALLVLGRVQLSRGLAVEAREAGRRAGVALQSLPPSPLVAGALLLQGRAALAMDDAVGASANGDAALALARAVGAADVACDARAVRAQALAAGGAFAAARLEAEAALADAGALASPARQAEVSLLLARLQAAAGDPAAARATLARATALPGAPRSDVLEAWAHAQALVGDDRGAYEAFVQAESLLRDEDARAAARRARALAARGEMRHAQERVQHLRDEVARRQRRSASLGAEIELLQGLCELGRGLCSERDADAVLARLQAALPALVPGARWQLEPGCSPVLRTVEAAEAPCATGGDATVRDRALVDGAAAWAELARTNAAALRSLDEANERLRAARDAEALARTIAVQLADDRSRFMSTLSHDLQSPLTALHGWLEALALRGDGMTPAERARSLRTALELCEQVRQMVGELVSLRDAAAGQPAPRWQRIDLAGLLQRVAGRLELGARDRGQQLRVVAPPRLPQALADEGMVDRIVTNLVDNALRHTPAGTRVNIELQARDSRLAVAVLDDGPGWPARPARLPGDSRVVHGMGLRIVQALLQQHAATLQRTSRDGWTTVFEFDLPAAPPA